MAWTISKNELLYQMLRERVDVERTVGSAKEWGLTRSWINLVDLNVSDAQKQLILNGLIDDKIVYVEKTILSMSTTGTSLGAEKTKLLTNKE